MPRVLPRYRRSDWDEGYDTGWSAGWKQGVRLTMAEVARRLIRDDVPMSYILEYTLLTEGSITKEFKKILETEGRVITYNPIKSNRKRTGHGKKG
jgi:hypothetical protein